MKKLIAWAEERVHNFTVWDMGMLKVCLFSLGTFLGMSAGERAKKTAPFFLITFFCSYIALAYRLVIGIDSSKKQER